jgi:SurA-like N-terminal domain
MRRIIPFAIYLLALLPTAVVPASAGEVLDGVVATVNRKPIFQSDWDETVCFEAFMQQKPIAQFTERERAATLQRIIDRQLLQGQMGDSSYMQPSSDDLQKELAKLRAQMPGGHDDQSWSKLLASYGLTEEAVKDHLRTETQMMNFVEVRLRPTVRVQPDEVEAYYQNQLLPDLRKVGGKTVSLSEAEPKIRELLTQQRMDELLDAWLHNLRQQAEIRSSIPIPALSAPSDQGGASGTD